MLQSWFRGGQAALRGRNVNRRRKQHGPETLDLSRSCEVLADLVDVRECPIVDLLSIIQKVEVVVEFERLKGQGLAAMRVFERPAIGN